MTRYQIEVCTGICSATLYKALRTGELRGHKSENGRWHCEPGAVYQYAQRCWDSGRFLMYPMEAIADYIGIEMAHAGHEPERTRPRKGGGDNER